ncbi:biopolymer transporter ExbD [Shimia sp. CNT1-13L.2]|uniref:biopolymer transporter ExbD n=1 Tax=Shimia sp. CNT1-13L.2 TaxID=2959663 RepID=UPI0020CF6A2B|nr:biopolymer transporter ExbD [Shimia sp. CNT1-13L.2]MCP9484109.1 biopolymer transporter ExbD [Shimia sp. CNT1-13L.2]
MDFAAPPRKPRAESIVPMINVVFLLLVFFLMTAQIAPPEPFEITRPTAAKGAEPADTPTLYINSEGEMRYLDHADQAALSALKVLSAETPTLLIKADAKTKAKIIARAMRDLAEAGFRSIEVVVETTQG